MAQQYIAAAAPCLNQRAQSGDARALALLQGGIELGDAQPRASDSVKAAFRLAASPAFHAQLSTIPPVGRLIRGTKELVSGAIGAERKLMIKSRFQGRRFEAPADEVPAPRMPSEGRVVREAYRAWVSNGLAKARLGWAPAHPFALGAQRTADWLRFARLI